MVPTEFDHRTTARGAAFGDDSDDAIVASITANLPEDGIAGSKMTAERTLPRSGRRMLDRRILVAALVFLDQDLAEPFLAGLSKYRALVKAARDSLADPQHTEVMVSLIKPYEITSTQHPAVALVIDEKEIGRVSFQVNIVFGLFETAVAVRRGAIEAVESEACSLKITLSLPGWDEPLLQRKAELPVRLAVKPPIVIPLPGSGVARQRH